MALTRLSENEIAEFLTKTERKESKNTQNILLDWNYLPVEEYLQEKKPMFISWNCAEKWGKVQKKVYEEVSFLRT